MLKTIYNNSPTIIPLDVRNYIYIYSLFMTCIKFRVMLQLWDRNLIHLIKVYTRENEHIFLNSI